MSLEECQRSGSFLKDHFMRQLCSIKKAKVEMLANLLFLIGLFFFYIMLFLSIQFDTEGKKYFKCFNIVSLFLI